jgi:glycosyltransferase involved in cell wall biosynthesis
MSITVAIPTLNRPGDMAAFMPTLAFQTVLPDEFIVVDAGDTSALEAEMEQALGDTGITLKYLRSERGLCLQRNVALDHATGDIIFFFDDDVELQPDYIEKVMECFSMETSPRVGCVQGTLIDPPATIDGWKSKVYRTFGLTHWTNEQDPDLYIAGGVRFLTDPKGVVPVPVAQGCRMAFRREVFETERFVQFLPGYNQNEDVDMTFRVGKNWTILQTPHAKLIHKESPVNRIQYPAQLGQIIYAHYYFFTRYREKTPANVAQYAWSHSGLMAMALGRAVVKAQPEVLKGIKDGYQRCVKDLVSP